jgi:hypothetical protein
LFNIAVGNRAVVSVQNPVQLSNYTEPEPDVILLKPRADEYAGEKPSAEDVLLVYRNPAGNRYATNLILRSGDSVSPIAFPDLVLAIDQLLV